MSRPVAISNPSSVKQGQGHIILHTMPGAWGHNKPLCALALRILEARPEVVVTYLTGAAAYSKIIGELKRWPTHRYLAVKSRLNIIDITGPDEGPLVAMELESFAPAFTALYSSLSVTCLTSGKTMTGLPIPTFAIIDPCTGYAFEAIRTVAGTRVPILAWFASNAGSLLRICGPPHLGGVADPEVETPEGRAEVKRKIKAEEPIRRFEVTGSTVNVPGIPPSYDYEWFPSALTTLADLCAIVEKACGMYVREADGIVCVSADVLEPEATSVAKEWFRSMKKPWYSVGPLSVHVPEVNNLQVTAGENTLLGTFLNRIQSKFGPKSMLYISFGTVFWPEESDRVWALVDGLIGKRQPFLFSHPSSYQQFPVDLKKKISDSGIAMEVSWAPQELVLAHPVTGWFLTHGGWNSTQEALFYRVPLIFWPFQADQPYNAMRISSQKAGFQLIEVRTGNHGMRKPYDYKASEMPAFTPASAQAEIEQIVDKIRGEEGLVVRRNFEAIGDAMNKTWDSPFKRYFGVE